MPYGGISTSKACRVQGRYGHVMSCALKQGYPCNPKHRILALQSDHRQRQHGCIYCSIDNHACVTEPRFVQQIAPKTVSRTFPDALKSQFLRCHNNGCARMEKYPPATNHITYLFRSSTLQTFKNPNIFNRSTRGSLFGPLTSFHIQL